MKNEPRYITANIYQRINWLLNQAKKFERRAMNNFEHAQHELRKARNLAREHGIDEWFAKECEARKVRK